MQANHDHADHQGERTDAGLGGGATGSTEGGSESPNLSSHVDEDPDDAVVGADPDLATGDSAGASPA